LDFDPKNISRLNQIRTPLFHAGRRPLIEPAQMRPPKPAVARAGYVIDGVGKGVMVTMVRDPGAGRAGSVKDREQNENLLDYRIQADGSVSQCAVVTDRGSEASAGGDRESGQEHFPSRRRK